MNAPGNPPQTYLALLHGINVAGKNVSKMADLQDCFKSDGFRDKPACA